MAVPCEEKADWVEEAKLAEQAERYQDMASAMKAAVSDGLELDKDERNLLSAAYKNVVGARRASYRSIQLIEQKPENSERKTRIAKAYKARIEKECHEITEELMNLLDFTLIPNASDPEAKAFYWKMKGDYYRYLGEVATGDMTHIISGAEKAYMASMGVCSETCVPTDPLRLGLALNFSVFYYEIAGQPAKACKLAQKAFDDAVGELDSLNEAGYKESAGMLQLLRDNLVLWTDDPSKKAELANGTA